MNRVEQNQGETNKNKVCKFLLINNRCPCTKVLKTYQERKKQHSKIQSL